MIAISPRQKKEGDKNQSLGGAMEKMKKESTINGCMKKNPYRRTRGKKPPRDPFRSKKKGGDLFENTSTTSR